MRIKKILLAAMIFTASTLFSETLAYASDGPSSWAVEQVSAAAEAGLVPEQLSSDYLKTITRAEYCALAVRVYEAVSGEITGRVSYSDTSDINVEKAAYAGIVRGVGDNKFDPDSRLTREMAAVVLANLADAAGKPFPKKSADFADINNAETWALEGIGSAQAAGIMGGVGDNKFAPKEPYTREQSIMTMYRIYNYFLNEGTEKEMSGINAEYIRTTWRQIDDGPVVTVIDSIGGLLLYLTQNDAMSVESVNYSSVEIDDAVARYTGDFFAGNYLVVVTISETSGSNRHEVAHVGGDGEIVIDRIIPEIGTMDMALWHILIEMDNGFKPSGFSVTFIEKSFYITN